MLLTLGGGALRSRSKNAVRTDAQKKTRHCWRVGPEQLFSSRYWCFFTRVGVVVASTQEEQAGQAEQAE